jgi:putative ABC transport system permease protein
MSGFWREILYSCRLAARQGHRLVSVAIVLTITLGVGTAAVVFSIVAALLIRDLPFPAAGELISVETSSPRAHNRSAFGDVATVALYQAWHRQAAVVADLAGFQHGVASLTGDWPARTVQVVGVTSNTIALLGAPVLLGRQFASSDDERGAMPSAILSHGLWIQLFGGDTAAMGHRLTLNGRDFRIIGVMPRGFHVPLSIPESWQGDPELWVPLSSFEELLPSPAGLALPLEIIGRVRAGVSLAGVELTLNRIAAEVSGNPENRAGSVEVNRLKDVRVRSARSPFLLLAGAGALVLLLMSTNIANLLLSRAVIMRAEIAVRIALGASRIRLTMQSVTEAVALSVLGGLLGFVLALVAVPWLRDLGAAYLPEVHLIAINVRVFAFSLCVAVASGATVGAWPALTALNRSPIDAITPRTPTGKGVRNWMRVLVVLEVAFAMVLLAAMGLLSRSYIHLTRIRRGYDARDVIAAGLILPAQTYRTAESRRGFALRLLDALRREPTISFPAISSGLPIVGGTAGTAWNDDWSPQAKGVRVAIWNVTGDYFRSLGIPVIHGTRPNVDGGSSGVAVDVTAARLLFGFENALGRRVVWGRDRNSGIVTAVVGDIQDLYVNLNANSRYRSVDPHIYVPMAYGVSPVIRISARSRSDARQALSTLNRAITTIDRNLPIGPLDTMEGLVRMQLARERFLATIVTWFATLAATLGCAGIFGMISHSTEHRTHEIGVRLALGARPCGVALLIIGDALILTAVGAAAGIPGAFAFNSLLRSALFELSPFDLITMGGVVFLTVLMSTLASALPAFRAATLKAPLVLFLEK